MEVEAFVACAGYN